MAYPDVPVDTITIQDFFLYLLKRHPKMLYGGCTDGTFNCEAFWLDPRPAFVCFVSTVDVFLF